MKPSSRIAGTCFPTAAMVGPSPEVRVYVGAMQLIPMTTAPIRPTLACARPLSATMVWDCDGCVVVTIGSPPLQPSWSRRIR